MQLESFHWLSYHGIWAIIPNLVPRAFFPGLGAGREKALASAGHVPTLHPEILGVIN